MGRHRLHVDPAGELPKGLWKARRQYRARDAAGKWVYFGSEFQAAIDAYKAWLGQSDVVRTVTWLLELCAGQVWPNRVKAKTLAPRTARDYKRDSKVLKTGLGKIPLVALQPKHIALFRDVRATVAPQHVRNEIACLAAALSYAVEAGYLTNNVAREVRRPSRHVRERLIADSEYLAVYAKATASERLAMVLCVRTLGLPGDVLKMGPRNLRRHDDGRRTLAFRRGKTGALVEIEIVGELAAVLEPLMRTAHPTFVRRLDGQPYTVDGIGSMFRRSCETAGVTDFGLRDLRAKGATEMYRADPNSIHQIQLLLGHGSVRTTQIYLKQLLAEIVRPNERPIIAGVV